MSARFGLRSLFFVTTAACLLLGLGVALSPPWSIAMGMFAVLAAAHVAGNVIGTRLKELAPPPVSRPSLPSSPAPSAGSCPCQPLD